MRIRLLLALLASSAVVACNEAIILPGPRAAEIAFATVPSSLVVGGTFQLTAVPRAASGRPVGRPVLYSSSDVSRATVSNNGLVTAVAVGTVRVTARSDEARAHAQIVVRSAPPSSM